MQRRITGDSANLAPPAGPYSPAVRIGDSIAVSGQVGVDHAGNVVGEGIVLCDVVWQDGSPVGPSPRQVLRSQVERARALGFEAMFGSELEFFLFRESYEEAWAKHYRDLTPSVPYILDYHILAAGYDEPFLREVRKRWLRRA
jgi:glutamine synthetase